MQKSQFHYGQFVNYKGATFEKSVIHGAFMSMFPFSCKSWTTFGIRKMYLLVRDQIQPSDRGEVAAALCAQVQTVARLSTHTPHTQIFSVCAHGQTSATLINTDRHTQLTPAQSAPVATS